MIYRRANFARCYFVVVTGSMVYLPNSKMSKSQGFKIYYNIFNLSNII